MRRFKIATISSLILLNSLIAIPPLPTVFKGDLTTTCSLTNPKILAEFNNTQYLADLVFDNNSYKFGGTYSKDIVIEGEGNVYFYVITNESGVIKKSNSILNTTLNPGSVKYLNLKLDDCNFQVISTPKTPTPSTPKAPSNGGTSGGTSSYSSSGGGGGGGSSSKSHGGGSSGGSYSGSSSNAISSSTSTSKGETKTPKETTTTKEKTTEELKNLVASVLNEEVKEVKVLEQKTIKIKKEDVKDVSKVINEISGSLKNKKVELKSVDVKVNLKILKVKTESGEKEVSLVEKKTNANKVIEVISKEIVNSASEIKFVKGKFNIIKNDPVIEVIPENSVYSYIIPKKLDERNLKKIITLKEEEIEKPKQITQTTTKPKQTKEVVKPKKESNKTVLVGLVAIVVLLALIIALLKKIKEKKANK
jgi:uncharacterized membrane protein YgcG